MEQLIEILQRWCEHPEKFEILKDDLDDFKAIYTIDFRHSYNELSKFLEKELGPDERDFLCFKIDLLLEELDKQPRESMAFARKGVFKLAYHVSLETVRLNRMNHIDFLASEAMKNLDATQKMQDENEEKVENLSKSINSFHGQSITILGIFTGIVIGFTSGMELIEGALNALPQIGMKDTVVLISVLGIILFNILFMFMYILSRISEKSVAIACKHKDCKRCRDGCKLITKAWRKYPYVLVCNGILILILLGVVVFYQLPDFLVFLNGFIQNKVS